MFVLVIKLQKNLNFQHSYTKYIYEPGALILSLDHTGQCPHARAPSGRRIHPRSLLHWALSFIYNTGTLSETKLSKGLAIYHYVQTCNLTLTLSLSIFSFVTFSFETHLPAFFHLNLYAFALRDYHRCFSSRLGPSNGKPQRALTLSLAPSWVGSWPAHLWSISGPIITLSFLASGTLPPSMHQVSGTLPLPILVISSVGTGGFH